MILDKDKTFLGMVEAMRELSECHGKQNACILVDRDYNFLSADYTKHDVLGEDRNFPENHNIEIACIKKCLLDFKGIAVCYTDKSPCLEAVKLLIKSDCHAIIFNFRGLDHDDAMRLWLSDAGGFRMWEENIK